jgi:uncharacterized protein RhaS with RHS repeats
MGKKIAMSDQSAGEIQYQYDKAGNLIFQKQNMSNKIYFSYDALGRVTLVDYSDDTPDVRYEYDNPSVSNSVGRLTAIDDGISRQSFGYSEQGTLAAKQTIIDGFTFAFSFGHDQTGRITEIVYPDGEKINKEYSISEHLAAVRWNGAAIVQYGRFKMDEAGNPILGDNTIYRRTGNGVETSILYNPATNKPINVESSTNKDDERQILEKVTYSYDSADNIISIADELDNNYSQEFEYDVMNRLVKAVGAYGTETIGYEKNGNIQKKNGKYYDYGSKRHAAILDADGTRYQ